jgi:hypothetical protein
VSRSKWLPHARRRIALSGLRHPVVKIHGQQRTGTNFVHRLIKANAPQLVSPWPEEGGWKHGPFEPHRRWSYLVVSRHPMAWVESLFDWEVKHGRSSASNLQAFLEVPSIDPRLADVWDATDPFEIYARSYAEWLDSPLNTVSVRYEDLLDDLDSTINQVFGSLRIERAPESVDVADRADVWQTKIDRRPLDRERSLNGWRHVVGETDLESARARIPAPLLNQLGYTI